MASFSASDAALTGFRVVRDRPWAVLFWASAQFVFSLATTAVMVQTAGPALTRFMSAAQFGSSDPAQSAALFAQLAPFYLLLFPITLAYYAILFATMDRAVLQPEEARFGYLRLGSDELRQLGLMLLASIVGIGAYIAFIVVVVVIAFILALAFGALSHGASSNPGAAVFPLIAVMYLVVIAGWIFLSVRLSLASAMTFATGRVDLFGSWRLTKGRFWPMLGAYLISWSLGLVVMMLTLTITLAVTVAGGGGADSIGMLFHPDMSSLGAYLTVARVLGLAVGAVGSALVWPVVLAPPAAIYKALEQTDAAATFG